VLPPRLDEAGRALSANADATRAQLQQLARDLDHNLAPVSCTRPTSFDFRAAFGRCHL
jgi:hypothetical protein